MAVHAAFLLLVTVPLCWRFRAPATVAIVVTAATGAWILTMFNWADQPPFEPGLAIIVALFALASRADGRPLWIGAVVSGVPVITGEIIGGLAGQGIGNVFPAVLLFSLAFVMGRIVHAHRRQASGQQDRAERLERDQEARAARAVATERARIARELHDVIAHSLSVIVVQAAAERRVLPAGQRSTAEALDSIEQSGRQAMTELRRLLGPAAQGRRRGVARPAARAWTASATWWPRSARPGSRWRAHRRRPGRHPPWRGPVGVPHRPGIPDQRAQARPGAARWRCCCAAAAAVSRST